MLWFKMSLTDHSKILHTSWYVENFVAIDQTYHEQEYHNVSLNLEFDWNIFSVMVPGT